MTNAKTIDFLGSEIHSRYAKDLEALDLSLIQESETVTAKTQVISNVPSYVPEYEALFGLQINTPLAFFSAPLDYISHAKNLFSFLLIPSLGSMEKLQRESEIIKVFDKQKENKKKKEDKEEQEKKEKERKTLVNLLNCIKKLNTDLALINALRSQYHKG
jgi:hypothetical protein